MRTGLFAIPSVILLAALAGCGAPSGGPAETGPPAPAAKPSAAEPETATAREGSEAFAVVVLYPRRALHSAALAPLMKDSGFAQRMAAAAGVDPRELESVAYRLVPADAGDGGLPFDVSAVFRFSKPLDADQWARKLLGSAPTSEPEGTWPKRKDYKGRPYYLGHPGPGGRGLGAGAACAMDGQTVFQATSEAGLLAMLTKQGDDDALGKRLRGFEGKGELVLVALPEHGRESLRFLSALGEARAGRGPLTFLAAQASAMMDHARAVSLRLDLDGKDLLEAVLEGKDEKSARNVEAAMRELLDSLKQVFAPASHGPEAEDGPAAGESPLAMARQLTERASLSRHGDVVTVRVPRPAGFEERFRAAFGGAMRADGPADDSSATHSTHEFVAAWVFRPRRIATWPLREDAQWREATASLPAPLLSLLARAERVTVLGNGAPCAQAVVHRAWRTPVGGPRTAGSARCGRGGRGLARSDPRVAPGRTFESAGPSSDSRRARRRGLAARRGPVRRRIAASADGRGGQRRPGEGTSAAHQQVHDAL